MASRRGALFAAIVAAVVVADQVSKAVVRDSMEMFEQVPVIDGVLWFTRIHNTGAAFGILRGQQWLLIITAVLMLSAVAYVMLRVRPASPWARVALALVTGGAIGNLIDRVVLGGVTDFFDLGWFPVFNIADIALNVGVAILVFVLLVGGEHVLTQFGQGAAAGDEQPVARDDESQSGEVSITDDRAFDA